MKKTRLLVLPLMSLLLTSCGTTIKGSDVPDLKKDPGHLLKLEVTEKISGNSDIIEDMGSVPTDVKLSYECYTNFVKMESKGKVDGENQNSLMYVMLKNNVTYVLGDTNGEKTKEETPDPTGLGFKAGSAFVSAAVSGFVMGAVSMHTMMKEVDNLQKASPDSIYELKRFVNTYTLSFTEIDDDMTLDVVIKLTIKNDYFTALEATTIATRDNKKATEKTSAKYTYAEEIVSYSESKMPKPADFA